MANRGYNFIFQKELSGLEKVINREVTPVNKEKIAKLAQMWRLLPPNFEFWQFFAIDSCLVYILGKRQKFHEKIC